MTHEAPTRRGHPVVALEVLLLVVGLRGRRHALGVGRRALRVGGRILGLRVRGGAGTTRQLGLRGRADIQAAQRILGDRAEAGLGEGLELFLHRAEALGLRIDRLLVALLLAARQLGPRSLADLLLAEGVVGDGLDLLGREVLELHAHHGHALFRAVVGELVEEGNLALIHAHARILGAPDRLRSGLDSLGLGPENLDRSAHPRPSRARLGGLDLRPKGSDLLAGCNFRGRSDSPHALRAVRAEHGVEVAPEGVRRRAEVRQRIAEVGVVRAHRVAGRVELGEELVHHVLSLGCGEALLVRLAAEETRLLGRVVAEAVLGVRGAHGPDDVGLEREGFVLLLDGRFGAQLGELVIPTSRRLRGTATEAIGSETPDVGLRERLLGPLHERTRLRAALVGLLRQHARCDEIPRGAHADDVRGGRGGDEVGQEIRRHAATGRERVGRRRTGAPGGGA